MLIEYQITTTGQCERFEDIPKGAAVLFIDGKEFIANCENCGKHLVDGDDFHMDEEGVYLCRPCANELFEAEQTNTLDFQKEEPRSATTDWSADIRTICPEQYVSPTEARERGDPPSLEEQEI